MESGAGAAALIKVLLMMKHKSFVPSINCEPLNPKIPFQELNLKVCQNVFTWHSNVKGNRIACINCFGFGGTNGHAVVSSSDYCTGEKEKYSMPFHTCLSLNKYVILSAADLEALYNIARNLLQSLSNEVSIADLSSTTVFHRTHFNFRKVFVVDEKEELKTKVEEFISEKLPIKVVEKDKPKIAFVYCGVGTTWVEMCKELLHFDDVFRKCIETIDEHLSTLTKISVQSIFENKECLSDPVKNHFAIFACQIGLTEMWKHVGVVPDCIVGQSVGEVAAAYASGALSLKDAVNVIFRRSENLALESDGKMIVVHDFDVKIVEEKCKTLQSGQANIAVYHSPLSCAVSGDENAIQELQDELKKKSVKTSLLNVKCAYHSHITKNASLRLKESLEGLPRSNPHTRLISTVTGRLADEMFGTASYWADNVSKPVLFYQAIKETMNRYPNVIFLELGPKPVLQHHLSNIFTDDFLIEALPSMKIKSEKEIFQKTFLDLFCKGISVTWTNIVPMRGIILPIPRYQFSKRKHLSTSKRIQHLLSGQCEIQNGMFLSKVPNNEDQFSMVISKEKTPFVYDHIMDENTVMPGAVYGEIALELGNILLKNKGSSYVDVSWTIKEALLVKGGEQRIVIKTKKETDQELSFKILDSDKAMPLSIGIVKKADVAGTMDYDISRLISILQSDKESEISYLALSNLGFQYGPVFQTIKKMVIRDNEIVSKVFISDTIMKEVQITNLHPVILDSMFQSCMGKWFKIKNITKERILPVSVARLIARQRPTQDMICYTTLLVDNSSKAIFDIILIHENGTLIAEIRGFEVKKLNSPDAIRSLSYCELWKPTELKTPTNLCTVKSIFVLSWKQPYLCCIEDAFGKTQKDVEVRTMLLTDATYFDGLEQQENIQNTTFVFAPGLKGINKKTTGEQLIESVNKMTNVFLKLIQSLYKRSTRIVVVTNETQACRSCNVRVLGAELWGMVRALTHEGTELSFTLLDIDIFSEFVLSTIVKMSLNIESNRRQVPLEYAIRGNVLYTNELTELPTEFHTRVLKRSFEETSQPICIRHQCIQKKESYFGIPSLVTNLDQSKLIPLKPIHTLVCNADSYFASPLPSQFDQSSSSFIGEEIRICEVIGKARLRDSDVEVVACCETQLKTELKIDKNCVFEISRLRNYKIGYLHAVIISQAIARLIRNKSNVIIEYSEKNNMLCYFLRLLLEKNNCTLSFQECSRCERPQNLHITELILLTKSGYLDENTFRLYYPNLKRCISLKGTLPLSMIKKNDPLVFHVIDVKDLYDTSNICQASQGAFGFLMSAMIKTEERDIYCNFCVLDIPEISRHLEIRTTNEFLIRRDSAYIVVGGLTGLGWLIIKYLAKRKAKKIISLSRRSLSSEAEQRILNIYNIHKVEIIHKEVDITNYDDLKGVVQSIQQQLPNIPVRGVFQGAGVLSDSTIPKMTQEQFNLPLKVKILGTWNLHLVTKCMELDIFMMHSSVASVFGNYSQTNYAAANAFLDSFAHYRKSTNLPGQTINWGALDVGMGSDPNLRDFFFHKGIKLMSKNHIQTCLTQLLLSDITQGIFVDFDIRRFLTANNIEWRESKYKGIVQMDEIKSVQELPKSYRDTESIENMIDCIKQVIAQVLIMDASEIKDTKTLAQLGVDSQNSIEIINTIFSITEVRIPILTLLSGGKNIRELVIFIREKMEYNRTVKKQTETDQQDNDFLSTRTKIEFIQQQQSALVFSFEISSCVNKPELWRKALQILIRVNQTIRITADSNTLTDIEDFILPFEYTQEKEPQSKIMESRDGVMSVIYEDMRSRAIIHIFCSRSHFDFFSGKIMLRDMQTIFQYVVAQQTAPAWLDKPNLDVVSLSTSKLRNVAKECTAYWKNRLLLCRTSASLKPLNSIPSANEKQDVTKISCPLINVRYLQHFALVNGLEMRSIITSAFMIVLHKITNAYKIPVVMEVDLRSQIPELSEQISPFSNFITIVSPNFGSARRKIKDYLNETNGIVKDGLLHSIFPHSFIKELSEFHKGIHMTHSLLFDTESNDYQYINMKTTLIQRHADFETLLYASHNSSKNTLSLELHFCSQRISSHLAHILTDYILSFVQTLPDIFTEKLQYLQSSALCLKESPVFLPPGKFRHLL